MQISVRIFINFPCYFLKVYNEIISIQRGTLFNKFWYIYEVHDYNYHML